MPVRGFYVIVSPEYRQMGCLPASRFIPALMQYLKEPYYTGLLSAGEFYGAAHQRPQAFQVVTEHSRPGIICDMVKADFIKRKSQSTTREPYTFVPMQDFFNPWTDEMLYEKYGIMEDEIKFINSMIRPMEIQGSLLDE